MSRGHITITYWKKFLVSIPGDNYCTLTPKSLNEVYLKLLKEGYGSKLLILEIKLAYYKIRESNMWQGATKYGKLGEDIKTLIK